MKHFLLAAMIAMPLTAAADDKTVTAPGTRVEYPLSVPDVIADQQVELKLTGAGLRQKFVFHVYAIGSYVEKSQKVKDAQALAALDAPKKLHLVMLRDVSGQDMAENIRTGVELNFPGQFDNELKMIEEYVGKLTLKKDQHVMLTHVPGRGLFALIGEKEAMEIPNVKFANAIWNIYLGKKNLGDKLKRQMTSRL